MLKYYLLSFIRLFLEKKSRNVRRFIQGIGAEKREDVRQTEFAFDVTANVILLIKDGLPEGMQIKSVRNQAPAAINKSFIVNDNLVVKFMPKELIKYSVAASELLRENIDNIQFPYIHSAQNGEYLFYDFLPGRPVYNDNTSDEILSDLANFIARLHALDVGAAFSKYAYVPPIIFNGDNMIVDSSLSEFVGYDISSDVKKIQSVFATHRLQRLIFNHSDLGVKNLLQDEHGRLFAVLDLDSFALSNNPLHEFRAFWEMDFQRLFAFIKIQNEAYKAHGLEIHISEYDAICAVKNFWYYLLRYALNVQDYNTLRLCCEKIKEIDL